MSSPDLPSAESLPATVTAYRPLSVVPAAGRGGHFVGRCWAPAARADDGLAGPRVVTLRDGRVIDVSARFATFTALLNHADPVAALDAAEGADLGALDDVLAASLWPARAATLRDETRVVLLAPNDLSATRACGVTFVRSLLERVVEEKAKGDPDTARHVRALILDTLGDDLSKVRPGSPATVELKQRLIAAGMWSQYLEVGIGPDAEVFTKAQPMASVGYGARIGVLPDSTWNNPEPEIVLAVSRRGEIRGATLGNDVNLRDYEGRSALLLGEAKDQNASCAIGPFVRLFDDGFTLDDVRASAVELRITGTDGFTTAGSNRMAEISRDPRELVDQVLSPHHQYPDGVVLFLGTMFAPTEDRDGPGLGFTHHPGDRVEIAVPALGTLVNWVYPTDTIPPWDYGASELLEHLIQRSLSRSRS